MLSDYCCNQLFKSQRIRKRQKKVKERLKSLTGKALRRVPFLLQATLALIQIKRVSEQQSLASQALKPRARSISRRIKKARRYK